MTEPSAWSVLPLPSTLTAASYLTGPLAKQYRLIVDLLEEQRSVTLTGVGFDELASLIQQQLPAESAATLLTELALEARMKQLVDWGTCTSWQDRAETQEDFLRNRHRYQLSDAGYQLNAAVRSLESELGATSTAVLLAPVTLLNGLNATVAALDADDAVAAGQDFSQVQTTLHAMSDAAIQWQNRLAAALGGSPNQDKVARLLETILTYADMWGAGVDAWSAPIAEQLPRLRQVSQTQWRAMVLARVGSSAPDALVDSAIAELQADVETLAGWFSGPRPQAVKLRHQIRDAVTPVLKGHRALLAVGGTVSRKADLLRLAEAIETADSDKDAWRIWCAATGLYSARHVSDTAPELANGHRVSVWDAEPVAISRRLRSQASRSLGGRPPNIVDRSQARARARRQSHLDRLDLERAAAGLAQRSGTPLSQWQPLGKSEADLFLELVTAARRFRAGAEPSQATTSDGRWTLRLVPRPGSAVLNTPDGRLVLPDADVEFST